MISEKTARNHVERTYAKIGVSNRIGASMYALQQAWSTRLIPVGIPAIEALASCIDHRVEPASPYEP